MKLPSLGRALSAKRNAPPASVPPPSPFPVRKERRRASVDRRFTPPALPPAPWPEHRPIE